jgi:hypothetical protein
LASRQSEVKQVADLLIIVVNQVGIDRRGSKAAMASSGPNLYHAMASVQRMADEGMLAAMDGRSGWTRFLNRCP